MINISNTKHWLNEQSEILNGKQAILFESNSVNFSVLYNQSYNLANYFSSVGIKENDHAAILCGNNIEFVKIVNALWMIGAVPVPLNPKNKVDEIYSQLKLADVKILLIEESLSEIFPLLSIDKKIIVINNKLSTAEFYISTSKFETQNSFHTTFCSPNSALILFTSGSTGIPKAVVHTFDNLYNSVLLTDTISNLSIDDTWLASLPFYHIGGFMILVRALLSGASLAFPASLNYADIADSLNDYNPTHLSLVSTTLQQLLKAGYKPNTNLKQLFLGGGPLDTQLCIDAVNNGFPIVKVYGSTETCSMVTALSKSDFNLKPDSSGRPIDDVKIKILDESGNELKTSLSGEIAVKSRTLAKEYFNNIGETKKKFINGFYLTGDFGFIDDDGFLYLESRREDIIISGGENISAKEIENVFRSNPLINDVYIFSQKDEKWGEILCAAIISNKLTIDNIKEFLHTKLPNYKIPKKIYLIDKIPRNELGKVIRTNLFDKLSLTEI